jgi:hypothetical protein
MLIPLLDCRHSVFSQSSNWEKGPMTVLPFPALTCAREIRRPYLGNINIAVIFFEPISMQLQQKMEKINRIQSVNNWLMAAVNTGTVSAKTPKQIQIQSLDAIIPYKTIKLTPYMIR